jgi:hypothetical protein
MKLFMLGPIDSCSDLNCLLPVSDPEELNKHFPTVDFVFDNNKMVTLAPENYLFKVWPLSIKEVQILLLV